MNKSYILSLREYLNAIGNQELAVKASAAYALKKVAGKSCFDKVKSIETSVEGSNYVCIIKFGSKKAYAVSSSKKAMIENLVNQILGSQVSVEICLEK